MTKESLDPLRHPDVVEVSRKLRRQLEQVLDAEQRAAAVVARRSRTLRDRLLDAEDRGELVVVHCSAGRSWSGRVVAVGADHVVVAQHTTDRFILLHHIAALEVVA